MKKFRGIFLKNDREIDLLREANRIVACILEELGRQVIPGKPTIFYEEICQNMCHKFGVTPSFQGLYGYPYALCCGLNDVVVHGFPNNIPLKEGDIISFDFGVCYKGFYGDAARTFKVGEVSPNADKLLKITSECLDKGVQQARVGNRIGDISRTVQSHAVENGFGVVRRFVGHGIGSSPHEKPEIANYFPATDDAIPLKAGMVICIEPMITEGTCELDIMKDKWTARTKDRKLSAHFEHCVAILPNGPEILDRT